MGFVMEANILNLIAACVMVQEWGMEELSFILYPNGYLEMEGNYSLRDDGWGVYPSQQDFETAKATLVAEGPWPFKPTVLYGEHRRILFEAGY